MFRQKTVKKTILNIESVVIFKRENYEYKSLDPQIPPTVLTFLSIEYFKEIFLVLGRLHEYFKLGDEVDIKYIQNYSNGIRSNRVLGIYHRKINLYYCPLKNFIPTISLLREKYQMEL